MMFQRLAQIGADSGIKFKFGGKTGNTRDSHRLIQLGKTKSPAMQTRVVEELFAAYFENEGDITSHTTLQNAGVKAGLDEKEVIEWLASERQLMRKLSTHRRTRYQGCRTSPCKENMRLVVRRTLVFSSDFLKRSKLWKRAREPELDYQHSLGIAAVRCSLE